MNNAGFTSANRVFTPSNAFDVDTSLASTTMPGFNEWSGLYRRYRTRASRITVDYMNNETFNFIVGVLPMTTNPGQNALASVITPLIAQPVTATKPLGSVNGLSACRIGMSMTTAKIAGVADKDIADDYSSAVSGAPLLNWYWNVFSYTGGGVQVSGMLIHVNVDIDLEFFDVAQPST